MVDVVLIGLMLDAFKGVALVLLVGILLIDL